MRRKPLPARREFWLVAAASDQRGTQLDLSMEVPLGFESTDMAMAYAEGEARRFGATMLVYQCFPMRVVPGSVNPEEPIE